MNTGLAGKLISVKKTRKEVSFIDFQGFFIIDMSFEILSASLTRGIVELSKLA